MTKLLALRVSKRCHWTILRWKWWQIGGVGSTQQWSQLSRSLNLGQRWEIENTHPNVKLFLLFINMFKAPQLEISLRFHEPNLIGYESLFQLIPRVNPTYNFSFCRLGNWEPRWCVTRMSGWLTWIPTVWKFSLTTESGGSWRVPRTVCLEWILRLSFSLGQKDYCDQSQIENTN